MLLGFLGSIVAIDDFLEEICAQSHKKAKKLKKRNLFYGDRPLLLGIGITVICLLAYFFLVGHPVWDTNDDVAMSLRAAGLLLSNQPSPHLLFSHPHLGWLISRLYAWKVEIPWYGIYMISVISLSLAALNFALLRLKRDLLFLVIVCCVNFITLFPILVYLQFTVVAGLAGAAGAMLFLSIVVREPGSISAVLFGSLISLLFLAIGFMIRSQSVLLVISLFSIFGVLVFLKTLRSKPSRGEKRKFCAMFVAIGLVLMLVTGGLQILENKYYQNLSDWQNWFVLNQEKRSIVDFGLVDFNDYTREAYFNVGWDRTDHHMIRSFQYVDPVQFSPDKFVQFNSSIQEANLPSIAYRNKRKGWSGYFKKMVFGYKLVLGRTSFLLCIPLVVLLTISWTKWSRFYIASVVLSVVLVLFYLYFVVSRAPFRVLALMCCCVLWLVMLIAAGEPGLVAKETCWKGLRNLARVLMVLLLIFFIQKDFLRAEKRAKEGVLRQKILERQVQRWNLNLPENSIIYSIGSMFPYEGHLPFKSFDYLLALKGFVGTGCSNQSPLQREILISLGLQGDFFRALAEKEYVYIVSKSKRPLDKDYRVKALREYYLEKYGLELSFSTEPDLPFLYRIAFN